MKRICAHEIGSPSQWCELIKSCVCVYGCVCIKWLAYTSKNFYLAVILKKWWSESVLP